MAIEFATFAGTTPVKCGTAVAALGSGVVDVHIKDLRSCVSGVKLVRADGSLEALELGANDDWNHKAASGETRYRACLTGAWADMVWQPGGPWAASAWLERLTPRSQFSGIGATLLALGAGQQDASAVRAHHVALLLLWSGATAGSLSW
jgi:hypothetical protein